MPSFTGHHTCTHSGNPQWTNRSCLLHIPSLGFPTKSDIDSISKTAKTILWLITDIIRYPRQSDLHCEWKPLRLWATCKNPVLTGNQVHPYTFMPRSFASLFLMLFSYDVWPIALLWAARPWCSLTACFICPYHLIMSVWAHKSLNACVPSIEHITPYTVCKCQKCQK